MQIVEAFSCQDELWLKSHENMGAKDSISQYGKDKDQFLDYVFKRTGDVREDSPNDYIVSD
ncbi:MAG TPA: hypothetical protein VFZ52_09635 [Chryseolinea sp.]